MFSQTQSITSQVTNSESNFKFEGEISEAQRLIPMLRAIHIKKTTVMAITNRGLKMTCQDQSKCLQATSFVDRSLFNRYFMSEEEIPMTVCFRLADLLNVLTIFLLSDDKNRRQMSLSGHTLKITYFGDSEKLLLCLSDETIATKAYIKTFNSEELMIFNMSFVNKIILTAESFIDFWKSVDVTSDWIQISIFNREPWLQFTTESERAKVNYSIDRDSDDVEQYQCSHEVTNRYKMSLLKFTLKALIHTSKLSIRTDSEGLLSLQFMIRLDGHDNEHCFVEYFIVPDVQTFTQ